MCLILQKRLYLDAVEEESDILDRINDAQAHGLRKEVKDEFDAWFLIPEVRQVKAIDPFRHSDISVNAVNQHGGRVLIYIV